MTKSYADTCLERAEKASPGCWDKEPRNSNYSTQVVIKKGRLAVANCYTTEDIEFIAHARTDVETLARRLKRACERLRDYRLEAPLEEK
jgi:hypothetical protein